MKYILFFLLAVPVFAIEQDNFLINVNLGNIGIAGNFPSVDKYNFDVGLSILSIGVEDRKANIGVEFSPYQSFNWTNRDNIEVSSRYFSLVNFGLYWNAFNHSFQGGYYNNKLYLGPFASLNYFFMGESFNWNKYIFSSGLRGGYKINYRNLYYNIFCVEFGYRSINTISKYFISAKIDIIPLAALLIKGQFAELYD